MTRDDILRWAKEAGIDVKAAFPRNPDVLTRFAQLAVDSAQPAPAPDVQPVAWRYKVPTNTKWLVSELPPEQAEEWNIIVDEQPLYTHPPAAAVQDLVAALMMIAGKQRCVDSLMSNVDIALEALKRWEGLK